MRRRGRHPCSAPLPHARTTAVEIPEAWLSVSQRKRRRVLPRTARPASSPLPGQPRRFARHANSAADCQPPVAWHRPAGRFQSLPSPQRRPAPPKISNSASYNSLERDSLILSVGVSSDGPANLRPGRLAVGMKKEGKDERRHAGAGRCSREALRLNVSIQD